MSSFNKIRILSRKSDLAVIQAKEVGNIIISKFPDLKIEYITKSTSGDIDLTTPLSEMSTNGVFTDDLRKYLINNKCDLVVHSWKDLPLDLGNKTVLAGTLERADQRDILFIKKKSMPRIKIEKKISILSSSPRRVYNLEPFAKEYLPFELRKINFINIRGNIPSRFKKFINGDDDGFILAKAALDRLLNHNIRDYNSLSKLIRTYIKKCHWTVTPLSINPTSPGQGALACEIRNEDNALKDIIEKINYQDDFECVEKEREILRKYGGGCHQKIGISFFLMHFGLMQSSRGETENGKNFYNWQIYKDAAVKEKISKENIYPYSLKDYNMFSRKEIDESIPKINALRNHCILVSRKSSLPKNAIIQDNNIVWTSGLNTWKALSKRGIWVNGSNDGMGENSNPKIESLTDKSWVKLTHVDAPQTKIKKNIATYKLFELPFKENIADKKYFFWMSSTAFKYAYKVFPSIIKANHACGPGNTYEEIKKIIKDHKKLSIALSYNDWKKKLLNDS